LLEIAIARIARGHRVVHLFPLCFFQKKVCPLAAKQNISGLHLIVEVFTEGVSVKIAVRSCLQNSAPCPECSALKQAH
jgi:hypothetical protein